jgi:hypothetical protein
VYDANGTVTVQFRRPYRGVNPMVLQTSNPAVIAALN